MISSKTILLSLVYFSFSSFAAPISRPLRREVPQEHSHEPFLASIRTSLASNNPQNLGDAVFGLLGNAAAAQGLGDTTDPDCLQQALADQAFTNAKAAGDTQGMVGALIFRALERNSGAVGQTSNACTSVTAVNPEIAAIQQHQDPASDNAAAVNKAIVLELAKQIASVGGDPQDALKSGTFAPGTIGDPTAKGNTCDDANDTNGCIFTQNLLVEDATADEINAAVAGVSASASSASSSNASSAASTTKAAAAASTAASSSIGDFGSCSVPQIEFAVGFDNRKETSFQPVDQTSYDHGSADNIDIITQFMCDQLVNSCGADATAQATCASAKAAADTATAKTGAQADAFNAVFGITTNFAAVTEVDDQGNVVAGTGSGASAASAADTTAKAAATTAAAAAATSAASSSSASGNNLQTFTGALGGISAPAVTAGGRGFLVDGNDSFLNLAAALGRSCDVQHNQCANAANSGAASGLTVGQCDEQDTQCKAA